MSNTMGFILAAAFVLVIILIFHGVLAILLRPIEWCYDLVFRKRPVRGWRLALAIIYGVGLMGLLVYSAAWAIPAFVRSQ